MCDDRCAQEITMKWEYGQNISPKPPIIEANDRQRCRNGTLILDTKIITDNVLHENPDSIGKPVEMVH